MGYHYSFAKLNRIRFHYLWLQNDILLYLITAQSAVIIDVAIPLVVRLIQITDDEHNQHHQLSERHNQLKGKSRDEQVLQNAVDRDSSLVKPNLFCPKFYVLGSIAKI